MDERTLDYYARHAEQLAPRYEQVRAGVARYFGQAFPPGARVLDIGAGTGRDVALLVADGIEAYGVEPVDAMRRAAIERHPELAARILDGSLPDSLPACPGADLFDGVLCSAVLQHLPRSRLFDALFAIRRLLKPRGRILLSVPIERDDVGASGRGEGGRLFNGVGPDELELLLSRMGFVTAGRWEEADGLGRPGIRWAILLVVLQGDTTARPLDRIEGVLRRDRKVATYKLALLRALAEIATTQPRRVRWRLDGQVALPIEAVAERWILYYWPLFAARDRFMPQMNGEWAGRTHRLGFAGRLEELMKAYARSGGRTAFVLDQRAGRFPGPVAPVHRRLMSSLKQVIREGPVTYAGGSLESGRLLGYEGGAILIDSALWRELLLTGHWIHDALILRWGEEVSRLSRGEVRPEQVVGLLLERPEAEREVAAAREVYEAEAGKECVWTGVLLRTRFEIDHVIPFSLWRNNDLWNLLPAHPEVNRRKRDRLPARSLLHRRRDAILQYWDLTRRELPQRFDTEAGALLGRPSGSPGDLFAALSESVEITALQRAVPRFAG